MVVHDWSAGVIRLPRGNNGGIGNVIVFNDDRCLTLILVNGIIISTICQCHDDAPTPLIHVIFNGGDCNLLGALKFGKFHRTCKCLQGEIVASGAGLEFDGCRSVGALFDHKPGRFPFRDDFRHRSNGNCRSVIVKYPHACGSAGTRGNSVASATFEFHVQLAVRFIGGVVKRYMRYMNVTCM